MKNLKKFPLSALILAFLPLSCSTVNVSEVPVQVVTAFESKYPAATNTEWEKESADSWEVEFKLENNEMEAEFSQSGEWLQTESEIETSSLPEVIRQAIETNYAGYKITEAESMERPEVSGYNVELSNLSEEIEVSFNQQGEAIAEEREDDDD